MHNEIERKFLLHEMPQGFEQWPHREIRQGYITTNSDNEVRLRAKADEYYLTVKQGSGLKRTEVEIPLSKEQFDALWDLTLNKRVEKTRYLMNADPLLIEIDVYHEKLAPLKVAEVEFTSIEHSRVFTIPAFFGTEVTDDKAYKNASLAINGIPESYVKDLS